MRFREGEAVMGYFPIFLELAGKRCVVVGGGAVAERKIRAMLNAGGKVRLIAPDATATLTEWAKDGTLDWQARCFQKGDLIGAFLVIAATDVPAANAEVAREAERLGLLFNAVADPSAGNFIVPSVVRRGDLSIAVSTGGHSPALAAKIRQQLHDMFGPEYATLVKLLGDVRDEVTAAIPDAAARQSFWQSLVSGELLARLARGEDESVVRAEIACRIVAGKRAANHLD